MSWKHFTKTARGDESRPSHETTNSAVLCYHECPHIIMCKNFTRNNNNKIDEEMSSSGPLTARGSHEL